MLGKRVTVIGLLQAVTIVTILFSVVTSFDSLHRIIELFSHFRLQYLGASLVLLVIFAALKNPGYAAPLLVTAAFNASFVLPWYVGGEPVASDASLKLLHANVLSDNDQYGQLLDLIEAEQPDVIFLQEFSPAWRTATEELNDSYPFSYTEAREGNFGIAMFSRLPLDSATHIDSPPLNYPTIVATMTVNGQLLTLINTHPTNPVAQPLHEARNEQLRSVADIARQARGAVLLTGDFNTTVWNHHYQALEGSTGLRNTRRGFGVQPTWPTFMPFAMIPIDHALASDEIGVVDTRTAPHIGSDHLPLILEFTVGT